MIITCIRDYKRTATPGELYINGDFFGYTLEDIGRPYGVKFPGDTCIAEGTHYMTLTYSNRFKRDMPLIYTEDDLSINKGGIIFTGVRVHGGNDIEDTEGCPLLGKHTNRVDKVWNCSAINKEFIKILRNELDSLALNCSNARVKYIVTSL